MTNIVTFPKPSRRDDRDPDIAICWELYCQMRDRVDEFIATMDLRMRDLTERQFSILYETISDEFSESDKPASDMAMLMHLADRENKTRPRAGGVA
jgi:hypothetical protein